MEKFDITEAYSAKADALAGKLPVQRKDESKGKDEKGRRRKK
jgi:hypothetical protein